MELTDASAAAYLHVGQIIIVRMLTSFNYTRPVASIIFPDAYVTVAKGQNPCSSRGAQDNSEAWAIGGCIRGLKDKRPNDIS